MLFYQLKHLQLLNSHLQEEHLQPRDLSRNFLATLTNQAVWKRVSLAVCRSQIGAANISIAITKGVTGKVIFSDAS